ncbi:MULTISPECIES: GNAT family N-acetyltransferase [unclassified Yoonia]|uniref:GNAT family N-acetyltransferase n=1 Tax=unclassified Yoonia TaxID=2629118 RepID=UPI002AFDDA15|nr:MULTISPECIES: GNAT family N-acetyltransferase [unclassified Yoonia]
MLIRDLDPVADLSRVHDFYQSAPDYWLMADRAAPDLAKARAFFTDTPPGCDPRQSQRLGLFQADRLSGVAELSFGFPKAGDAYLGLLMLGPWARNAGVGAAFLAHIEAIACAAGHDEIYLAVLDMNVAGRRFWHREGFRPTGVVGRDAHGQGLTRLSKQL